MPVASVVVPAPTKMKRLLPLVAKVGIVSEVTLSPLTELTVSKAIAI
jgi:hypothetical protein